MPKIPLKNFELKIGHENEVYDPNKLLRVPPCTFRGYKVHKVTIYSHVTHIGERAFQSCRLLQKILLPNALEVIERSAFENCISLTEIYLPDGVREIGDCAFANCALKEITLPQSLQALSFNVFRDCSFLKRAYLPDGIKEIPIAKKAFENCYNLLEISVCADCVVEDGALPQNCQIIYREE